MPDQRKGGPDCFEQGSYNFSQKKKRAKQAKPKDSAVSHQSNQGLNVLNKDKVCFNVTFFNSLWKKGRTELLWTRVLQFHPQEKDSRRSKAQGSCSFLSKESLSKGTGGIKVLYSQPLYILFQLMVHCISFKLNVCASHAATRSLPQIEEYLG